MGLARSSSRARGVAKDAIANGVGPPGVYSETVFRGPGSMPPSGTRMKNPAASLENDARFADVRSNGPGQMAGLEPYGGLCRIRRLMENI